MMLLLTRQRPALRATALTIRISTRACSTGLHASEEDVSVNVRSSIQKRVRQHVNPLSMRYQQPIELPDWNAVFARPELPIHLDIGCARGKYLNTVAERSADTVNFVGVEIRESVLEEARDEARARNLRNIAYVHANMNVQQKWLIPSLPGRIQSVSIFHPDPWMKKRHVKRRLVVDSFVTELAELLGDQTPIYLQTDVRELFEYMVEVFERSTVYDSEPLVDNPFGVSTDREKYVRGQGGDIYRIKLIVDKSADDTNTQDG